MANLQIRIILACLICFTILVNGSQAYAKSKNGKKPKTYFSASGFLFNVEDQSENISGSLVESDTSLGFGGALAVGTKLQKGLRAEFEYAYRVFDFDVLVNSAKVSEAESTINSIMANLAFDMRMSRRLSPYFGIGMGWAWEDGEITSGAGSGFKASSDGIAYQGLAGIRYKVTTKFGLLLGYRYFLIDYDEDDTEGGNFELGMRLFF